MIVVSLPHVKGDFVVALLDIMGADLDKLVPDLRESNLNHQLRQALLSCAGGGRLDDAAGGPQELLHVCLAASAGASA